MFFNPGVVYMLASVALSAVAVVVHFHVSHLSLPLPSAMTIATVLLPIGAFLNAYVYPNLLLRASRAPPRCSRLAPQRLAPLVLQGLQALLTAVLATALLLRGVVPSPFVVDVLLDDRWRALFQDRDALRIELLQDSFNCCGFRAVDDRAFPFTGQSCVDEYHRHISCRDPWASAMQATSALDFAVVLAVGLMQLLGLLLMRERTGWWTALRTQNWKQADDGCQPLLPDPHDADDADTERQRPAYGALLQANRPDTPTAEASRRAVTH
ncbi:hypothetical protein XA68_14179 [Ophiocordyceps unilateralis]|uniref:Tetraspanin Tsp3 n=1 Tax=Ophiocordyceps unilateralis TaxID=268505 RepID=A0A2A9PLS9_OPHUN|nr:hypothetical protein XA68_14179 [Ophiocordyceps unilateralis]